MPADAEDGATLGQALIAELVERRAASVEQEARLRAALRDVVALLGERDRGTVEPR